MILNLNPSPNNGPMLHPGLGSTHLGHDNGTEVNGNLDLIRRGREVTELPLQVLI